MFTYLTVRRFLVWGLVAVVSAGGLWFLTSSSPPPGSSSGVVVATSVPVPPVEQVRDLLVVLDTSDPVVLGGQLEELSYLVGVCGDRCVSVAPFVDEMGVVLADVGSGGFSWGVEYDLKLARKRALDRLLIEVGV